MKFVNGTLCDRRCPGDKSDSPYGRKVKITPPPPVALPAPMMDLKLQEFVKSLKPEPKEVFQSKMLRASRELPVSQIQKETEDILAVLRNLHKK